MSQKDPEYKLLDHTADLGISVQAESLEGLWEHSARVLMHLLLRGKSPEKTTPLRITISGCDLEDLLVRWLGEVLYLFEAKGLVTNGTKIDFISEFELKATVYTVPFDQERYEIIREIKAVTYHQIKVIRTDSMWEAQIIFDL